MDNFKGMPGDRKVKNFKQDFWNAMDVLCTDGTLWHYDSYYKRWERRA